MSAQQYIVIGGVAPGHNIVVEILIPTRRLSVLPFSYTWGLCELLNFSGSIIFNEHNICKELIINSYSSPTGKDVVD